MTGIAPSKTQRLYLLLKERIMSGHFVEGQRLPSEHDLAEAHRLSRVTVRRALDGLAEDGLVRRQAGAGTFIARAPHAQPLTGNIADTLSHIAAMGRTTHVRLLSVTLDEPPMAIREALGLAAEERTQHAVRVRSADGAPFSHLVTHVPERIAATYSEAELGTTPLLTLLERSGVVVARARQSVAAVLAGPAVAEALSVAVGSALTGVTRTVYDEDGRGVEHLVALYRPDRYTLEMDMVRSGGEAERHWRPVLPDPNAPPGHAQQGHAQNGQWQRNQQRRPIGAHTPRRRR